MLIYRKLFAACLGIFIILGFSTANRSQPKNDIEGTWKLVSYKYGEEEFFSDVPELMQYRKVLTNTHYQWVAYGEGDELLGAGGGTYQYSSGKYTERSDFFYPRSTEIVGKSIVFKSQLEGSKWTIEGVFTSIKINPETGEKEGIKEVKVAEVWTRVE